MTINKEVAVVTGASRGIGKAIALKMAGKGYDVVIFGRDNTQLQIVCEELKKAGSNSIYFSGDAADESFVKSSIEQVLNKYGKIDHLINNAGIGIFKKFINSSLDDFKKQVDVNLYGVYNFTRAVINKMIEQRSGSIINIASLAGKNSFVGGTMYSATKHALLGFSRSLMLEVREYNIRVASICPGSVDTEFSTGERITPHKKNILLADDVADTVLSVISMPVRALVSEIDLRPTNP